MSTQDIRTQDIRTQHHGHNLVLLTLLLLISACGPNAEEPPKVNSQGSETNGADTEVVTEPPAKLSTKLSTEETPAEEDVKASATELSEEETGIADLREIVDEIAPESEQASDVPEETGTKQASSPVDDKAPDLSTTNTPENTPENATIMMALADGGLQTVNVQTGSTLDLAFELDQEIVVSSVSTVFGDPTETVDTTECPAGPLKITTWPNGFSVNTLEQTFVGWHVRPNSGSENLTTIAGVGIGTSLKDLQDAYEVEIIDSSLGIEFNVGQMSGLLSSDQPDGVITNLWAGMNCIFR